MQWESECCCGTVATLSLPRGVTILASRPGVVDARSGDYWTENSRKPLSGGLWPAEGLSRVRWGRGAADLPAAHGGDVDLDGLDEAEADAAGPLLERRGGDVELGGDRFAVG